VQVPRAHYEGMQSKLDRMTRLEQDYAELKAQLDWFKRQMFGAKSEKRSDASPDQAALFNALSAPAGAEAPKVTVPAHASPEAARRSTTAGFASGRIALLAGGGENRRGSLE